MRVFLSVMALSTLCLPIAWQLSEQDRQAKALLDQGMSTLQAGKKEDACFLFDQARVASGLIKDVNDRIEFAAKIDFQAALADPLTDMRRKGQVVAARALLRAGRVYLKKGWSSTATLFISEAALLAPELAAADLQRLSAGVSAKRGGGGSQILKLFGHMDNTDGQAAWIKLKNGLKPPIDGIEGTSMLLSKADYRPGYRIRFEVLAPEAECRIALGIGNHEDGSFHLVELYRSEGRSSVRCHAYVKEFKTLVWGVLDIKKSQWKDWLLFDVEVRENELTFRIGRSKTYVTRSRKPDLSGKLGLYVHYGDANLESCIFRNFRKEAL